MTKVRINDVANQVPYEIEDLTLDPQLERRYNQRIRKEVVKARQIDRRNKRQTKRSQAY